jgi:uncharacterized protein YcbK (DUF882 family)
MSVGGEDFSPKTLAALNTIRETTKRRYRILSAYRSPNHNKFCLILIKERSVGGRMMTMEMLCLEIKNDNISIRLQII